MSDAMLNGTVSPADEVFAAFGITTTRSNTSSEMLLRTRVSLTNAIHLLEAEKPKGALMKRNLVMQYTSKAIENREATRDGGRELIIIFLSK